MKHENSKPIPLKDRFRVFNYKGISLVMSAFIAVFGTIGCGRDKTPEQTLQVLFSGHIEGLPADSQKQYLATLYKTGQKANTTELQVITERKGMEQEKRIYIDFDGSNSLGDHPQDMYIDHKNRYGWGGLTGFEKIIYTSEGVRMIAKGLNPWNIQDQLYLYPSQLKLQH